MVLTQKWGRVAGGSNGKTSVRVHDWWMDGWMERWMDGWNKNVDSATPKLFRTKSAKIYSQSYYIDGMQDCVDCVPCFHWFNQQMSCLRSAVKSDPSCNPDPASFSSACLPRLALHLLVRYTMKLAECGTWVCLAWSHWPLHMYTTPTLNLSWQSLSWLINLPKQPSTALLSQRRHQARLNDGRYYKNYT